MRTWFNDDIKSRTEPRLNSDPDWVMTKDHMLEIMLIVLQGKMMQSHEGKQYQDSLD